LLEGHALKDGPKKFPVLIRGALSAGIGVLALSLWLFSCGEVSEVSVKVVEVQPSDKGGWVVSKDAVGEEPGESRPFVMRLRHLRTERLPVEIIGRAGGDLVIGSQDLKPKDVLVISPGTVAAGQAVAITGGLDEERLVRLTLEAGMAAVVAGDPEESVRFISLNYADDWGFNRALIGKLLKRAYKEFDDPRMELAGPLEIQVQGNQAVVEAKVRLTAMHTGRRNFLLGDQKDPNQIFFRMEKSFDGWKVASMKGLRPLGFEEKFIRLLGAEIGLTLTEAEGLEKKEACMPCRGRMLERFGPDQM
jgi:hypothetical protein